jgi:hypothetical protein
MKNTLPTAVAGTVFLGVLLLAREYNTFKQVKSAAFVFRPQWPQMTTLHYQKPFVPVIEPEVQRQEVVLDFEGPFRSTESDALVAVSAPVVWSGTTYMTGVLAVLAVLVLCVGLRGRARATVRGDDGDHIGVNMMHHVLQATERRRRQRNF